MKQKVKKLLLVLILTIISIMGMGLINNNNVQAATFEIFNDTYVTYGNWWGIPVNILGNNISLWCIEHNKFLGEYITAPTAIKEALNNNQSSNVFLKLKFEVDGYGIKKISERSNLYKYFRRNESLGLLKNHQNAYNNKKNEISNQYSLYGYELEAYKGDDELVLSNINNDTTGLPIRYESGTITRPVYSITYSSGNEISDDETDDEGTYIKQAALYVLSAMPVYTDGVYRWGGGESLTNEQKAKGYFTAYEKQWALWELGVNQGRKEYTDNDRNLGNIADGYQTFYNQIHINGYSNIVSVKSGDNSGEVEKTTTEINGEQCDTYVFDAKYANKKDNNTFVLGPYKINYATNPNNNDIYKTTDEYKIKFNAIENIKVYNKNKEEIKSFRIAYSADGQEVETTRINDSYYYANADGASVPGFESNKEFYIIVDRGTMKEEDFTGLFAKIDFQYLDHIDGTLQKYNGEVYVYYYQESSQNSIKYEVKKTNQNAPSLTPGITVPSQVNVDGKQYSYELKRMKVDELTPQTLLSFANATRVYKTYSIILTSEVIENTNIEIFKKCSTDGEPLSGAKFNVSLQITSTDGKINKKIDFANIVTNDNGIARISSDKIKEKGVDLEMFTGTIVATFEETQAPESHEIEQKTSKMTVNFENGKITNSSSTTNNTTEHSGDTAKITILNKYKNQSGIEIQKISDTGNLPLKGAKFNVTIIRKRDNSEYRFDNLVTDNNGKINITFQQIKNAGFSNIETYSGNITVSLLETEAPENYEIIQENSSMTLTLENGIIKTVTSTTNDGDCELYEHDNIAIIKIKNKTKSEDGFEIYKIDEETKAPLKGAKFNVKFYRIEARSFSGIDPSILGGLDNVNLYKLVVIEEFQNLETDDAGLIKIPFTGTKLENYNSKGKDTDADSKVYVDVKETQAPVGCNIDDSIFRMILTIKKGKITSVSDMNSPEDLFVLAPLGLVDDNLSSLGESVLIKDGNKTIARITIPNQQRKVDIEIYKRDELEDTGLKAKFYVKIVDKNGRSYVFDRLETNDEGFVTIKNADMKNKGLDLLTYIGDIKVSIIETEAPEGYKKIEGASSMTIRINRGAITRIESETADDVEMLTDKVNNKSIARITIYNDGPTTENPLPRIKILKVNQNGNPLEGANLSVTINGKVKARNNNESEKTIGFSRIFSKLLNYNSISRTIGNNYDSSLVNELNDVEKNNAVKLFKAEFGCGPDGDGIDLNDVKEYVQEKVIETMNTEIEKTTTWVRWEGILNSNSKKYEDFQNARNAIKTDIIICQVAAATETSSWNYYYSLSNAEDPDQDAINSAYESARDATEEREAAEEDLAATYSQYIGIVNSSSYETASDTYLNYYDGSYIEDSAATYGSYSISAANVPTTDDEDATNGKMKQAHEDIKLFAEGNPNKTSILIEWLQNKRINPTYIRTFTRNNGNFGSSVGTASDSIPASEFGTVEFKISALEMGFSGDYRNNSLNAVLTTDDFVRIYTGRLTAKVKEISAPSGYVTWENDDTKTVYIICNDGKITGSAYDSKTNDNCEIVPRIENISEKINGETVTVNQIEIKAYNQLNVPVFRLTKYEELTKRQIALQNISFNVKITAKGVNLDGSIETRTKTFSLTTDSYGQFELDAEEYCNYLGIDVISRWIGTLEFNITEIYTKDGLIKWSGSKSFTVDMTRGRLTNNDNSGAIEVSLGGVCVNVDAYNTYKYTPTPFIIKKVDLTNSVLKNAVFDIKISGNGKEIVLSDKKTNEAGEIVIYAEDFAGPNKLGIDVINRWTGTLRVTLTEKEAPEGYKKINGNIVIDVTLQNGKVTKMARKSGPNNVSFKYEKVNYKDEQGNEGESTLGTIITNNILDAKLRLRKVDETGKFVDGLKGTKFKFTLNGTNIFSGREQIVDDEWGYIDLTSEIEKKIGELGRYSGTLTIQMTETKTPSGYISAGTTTILLTYKNGKLLECKYNDAHSKAIVDVGDSANSNEVTIAVKNRTDTLEPIYISKVDSQTGKMLHDAEFKVSISKDFQNNVLDILAKTTNNDGLITITAQELNKADIPNGYTGDLYVHLEETKAPDGYKKLSNDVLVKFTYKNGLITGAEIISNASYTEIAKDDKSIKLIVKNDRQIPDLVIRKLTLGDGENEIIDSAKLKVKVTATKNNATIQATRELSKEELVNNRGEIIFTSEELEKRGINEKYDGNLKIEITETSLTDPDAAMLPGTVTATLTLKNGQYVSGETSNEAHCVFENKNSEIIVKALDTKKPEYMTIAGKVWKEGGVSKSGTVIDGLYGTKSITEDVDKLYKDIEVTLYKVNGNKLEFATVEKGTNPTLTDVNGEYKFYVKKSSSTKYVVMFTYNGQVFEDSTIEEKVALENWENSSKGTELKTTRNSINNMLKEIGAYPANYKMKKNIFDSNIISKTNSLQEVYKSGYNLAYRSNELSDVYENLAIEMNEYLGKNKYINSENKLKNIYLNVVNNHYKDDKNNLTDIEIYNKLQYIYDTRMSAYAGYYTSASEVSSAVNVGKYPIAGESDYLRQQYVNMGVVERDKTDLTLSSDLDKITVSINGKDMKYTYGELLSEYTQYIHEEDYNYRTTQNSDGEAWYNNDEIEVYITYKIKVENETSIATWLTKVSDYFDNRLTFNNNYTTSSNTTIKGVEANCDITKIEESVASTGYKKLDISIKENTKSQLTNTKNKVEIYLTFKLGGNGKTAKELLQEFLTKNPETLSENNYAEIAGYKTQKGYLDADSKPCNMKIDEYEKAVNEYNKALNNYVKNKTAANKSALLVATSNLIKAREDDAWRAKLNIKPNRNFRNITGNVWKANDSYSNELFKYINKNGLEGIIVELVEVEGANQVVRARTVTNGSGEYRFNKYIPGDYSVRFRYGETIATGNKDYSTAQGNIINTASKTYNGQYYQSVKANPDTNGAKYWYAVDINTRYSDAYDDVNTRLAQIEANIGENSTSWNYEWDGVNNVQGLEHIDKIDAYTSTIEAEVEYTRTADKGGTAYTYGISNVDFGIVPRVQADLNIDQYVSNIKIYLQDGTKQLDVDFNKNGSVKEYKNDSIYQNIVVPTTSIAYRDGLIEVLYDEQLLNGATMEVTYTVTVSNNGEENTIKYFYDTNTIKGTTKPIALAYFGENVENIVYYEGGSVVIHEGDAVSKKTKAKEISIDSVKTRAANIVDYIEPSLNFIQVNKEGTKVNQDWEIASRSDIHTTRTLDRYNTIVRAKVDKTYTSYLDYLASYAANPNIDTYDRLNKALKPGESITKTLTLSTVLETSSTETNDYEYGNFMEIAKIENYVGKITNMEGYDITGEEMPETSEEFKPLNNKSNTEKHIYASVTYQRRTINNKIYKTLGSAKAGTIVIHAPTGLIGNEKIFANTGIILVSLVILAGGIILIKKFVLTRK